VGTFKLNGKRLDLVSLVTYDIDEENNLKFHEGNAEQDALRRDFSINSIFYNINTSQIEDYSKLGLKDLENKIIRCPADPYTILYMDASRLCRAVRFAIKYGFTIDESVRDTAKLQDVKMRL